jgi:hypothetical protein
MNLARLLIDKEFKPRTFAFKNQDNTGLFKMVKNMDFPGSFIQKLG